jgi:hypothetical protein
VVPWAAWWRVNVHPSLEQTFRLKGKCSGKTLNAEAKVEMKVEFELLHLPQGKYAFFFRTHTHADLYRPHLLGVVCVSRVL